MDALVLASNGSLTGVYPGDVVKAYSSVVNDGQAFVEAGLEVDGRFTRVFFPLIVDDHQVLVPIYPE